MINDSGFRTSECCNEPNKESELKNLCMLSLVLSNEYETNEQPVSFHSHLKSPIAHWNLVLLTLD